jgi:hypothetical protein
MQLPRSFYKYSLWSSTGCTCAGIHFVFEQMNNDVMPKLFLKANERYQCKIRLKSHLTGNKIKSLDQTKKTIWTKDNVIYGVNSL